MPAQLGLTFHRKFTLVRPAVGQIVALAASIKQGDFGNSELTKDLIGANSNLGTIYAEAMPRYARGSGLLDDNNHLTLFGDFASRFDEILESPDSQWLIHYFMGTLSGPGPEFWHELCAIHFRVGNRFTRQAITADIAALYEKSNGRPASTSALKSTTSIFLGTYTKSDGLGNLGILHQDGEHFVVTQPDAPSAWAFAYALIDNWERRYGDRLGINLDEMTQARGLGSLFLMDETAVNTTLGELKRAGVVDLYRSARPYQLLLLTHDREAILRKIYGVDDSYPIG